ncbi:MAG TPA: SPFH domain-containing protein [Pyrinomonadaceae bacterium]|jgi:membrane protease subunit (stomatin/prohibitin family)|nr:SPFH domain-containing protein [Pyrinomonadaceae bacterium]
MGIMDALRSQFIEVIEWLDNSSNTMLYRFPVEGQEIKNGARLVVRESQAAVFVFQGQIADVFPPGLYTVEGGNTPLLTKLGAWKYGFNSPFKSEVYFVNTKQFTDLKWGTPNPVMMRDADFGMVRLRAFGIYTMRIIDPRAFIKEVAGTNARFETADIEGQLKRTLVSGFTDALGESKIPALDLASNYDELSRFSRTKLNEEFKAFGLELTKFIVENISLPQEVEAAMDKRTSMGVIGDVNRYTQFQAADAMRAAAENPSGGAGTGAGLGAGFAIGNAMAGAMSNALNPSQQQQQGGHGSGSVGSASTKCPKCGAANDASSKFCNDCGAKLEAAAQETPCIKCGSELHAGAKFCSQCGAKQEEEKQKCPNCHAEAATGAKFCNECGTKIEGGGPTQPAT